MPKISTQKLTFDIDNVRSQVDVELNYDSSLKFYVKVPENYRELCQAMEDEEREELFIYRKFRSRRTYPQNSDPHNFVVTGDSESECIKNFEATFIDLSKRGMIKRNVIVIEFEDKDAWALKTRDDDEDETHINEKPETGFTLGFDYAVETIVGTKKSYYVYTKEYELFGEMRIDKSEISVNDYHPKTIIDDTPENRKAIEELYNALKKLKKRLKDITTDPDNIIKFIDSKQKLLN